MTLREARPKLTLSQKKLMWDRVQVPEDPQECWIWIGPLSTAKQPWQQFTVAGERVATLVTHALYEELHKVKLERWTQFHLCTKTSRCVNPLHNYPFTDCFCAKCKRSKPL